MGWLARPINQSSDVCGEYDSGEGEGGFIIFMNEVNCKLYEKEKGGLVGQAHQLIIRCVWKI